jgi:hypothetical protein
MPGKAEYGFASMGGSLFGTSTKQNINPSNLSNSSGFAVLRVKDIILSPSDKDFENAGGWDAIGAILFENITTSAKNEEFYSYAYPYFANIKHYPLIGELVFAIILPNANPWEQKNISPIFYYFPPINIWKNTNVNSSPYLVPQSYYSKLGKSPQQAEVGSTNKITNKITEFSLGKTFKKTTGVNPLQPQEGDVLIEGRFGNSIKLGSNKGEYANVIIRSGQGESQDPGITIEENIQSDSASIYLTTKQTVPLEANTFSYGSYDIAPKFINEFDSSQVVINSGRLVLNSNSDHTLINSATSINLNSQGTVNIDSKDKFVINCNNLNAKKDSQGLHTIYLGSKNATEPVALGGKTTEVLVSVLDQLILVLGTLETLVGFPAGVPNIPVNASATAAKQTLTTQVTKLRNEYIKSPICKTL